MNVLITFVEWRKKYAYALGDISFIDKVFDCSVIGNSPEYVNRSTGFSDSIKSYKPSSISDLVLNLDCDANLDIYILFPRPTSRCLEIIKSLPQKSNINIICNKGTRYTVPPYILLANYALSKITKFFSRSLAIKINAVYTNDKLVNAKVISCFKPKKVMCIKALDCPQEKKSCNRDSVKTGVFYDSYFPFHKELALYGDVWICPAGFYGRVNTLMKTLKQEKKLDKILFSPHPNSNGDELKYIDDEFLTTKSTRDLVLNCNYHWAFGSDALFLACLPENYICCVDFPDILPSKISKYIKYKARLLAADYLTLSGKNVKVRTKTKKNIIAKRKSVLNSLGFSCSTLSEQVKFK
ncbi:hypothetical protein [Halomonas tibetensis]|uniref:CDP-glycerol--glycerophosphate glycerophosphotransferase n=1 Tax=Halomonas tibetensis TaxID=2259590 RepID=A0ABV7B4Q7_9GAMM